jgi:hypothetical protein
MLAPISIRLPSRPYVRADVSYCKYDMCTDPVSAKKSVAAVKDMPVKPAKIDHSDDTRSYNDARECSAFLCAMDIPSGRERDNRQEHWSAAITNEIAQSDLRHHAKHDHDAKASQCNGQPEEHFEIAPNCPHKSRPLADRVVSAYSANRAVCPAQVIGVTFNPEGAARAPRPVRARLLYGRARYENLRVRRLLQNGTPIVARPITRIGVWVIGFSEGSRS